MDWAGRRGAGREDEDEDRGKETKRGTDGGQSPPSREEEEKAGINGGAGGRTRAHLFLEGVDGPKGLPFPRGAHQHQVEAAQADAEDGACGVSCRGVA